MLEFYIRTLFLSFGLAMDSCAVSMSNGFSFGGERRVRVLLYSIVFAIFQGGFPLIAFFISRSVLNQFIDWLPTISFVVLGLLGLNMILGAIKTDGDVKSENGLSVKYVILQAVATSLDAFSVGFTFVNLDTFSAIFSAFFISIFTFILSFISFYVGKYFGIKLGNKAEFVGGGILILIGAEIVVKSLFF